MAPAGDRFDSDCVVGTQFESSQPHHAVSRKQRFPCSLLIAPNWPGAAAGSIDQLDEQLRVSVEALLHPSPPPKPELDDLLSGITHHLDDEASE